MLTNIDKTTGAVIVVLAIISLIGATILTNMVLTKELEPGEIILIETKDYTIQRSKDFDTSWVNEGFKKSENSTDVPEKDTEE